MIDLSASTESIIKANILLSHIKGGAPRAINAALNRTIDGVKTDIVREITKTYYVKVKNIRAAMTVQKSTFTTLRATASAKGGPLNLINFRVSPSKPGYQPKGTVLRASLKRNSPGGNIPGAFVMDTNTRGSEEKIRVVRRLGKERFPLKGIYGPSVPQMMGETKVQQFVTEGAGERFEKRLDHEIGRLLERG